MTTTFTFTPSEDKGSLWCRERIFRSEGRRVWLCKFEDRDGDWRPVTYVSRFTDGLDWPPSWRDNLICVETEETSEGVRQPDESAGNQELSLTHIIARYENVPPLIGGWTVKRSSASKVMTTGIYRLWLSDGAPTDQAIALPYRRERVTATKAFLWSDGLQLREIRMAEQKINRSTWFSPWGEVFDPETALFESKECDQIVDNSGAVRNLVTFNFLVAPQSHNIVLRAPVPVRINSVRQFYGPGDAFPHAPMLYGSFGWDAYDPPDFELWDFSAMMSFP